MQRFFQYHFSGFLLLLALAIAAPIFLYHPLADSNPMGYAGLFTQMAEQIAESDFRLPHTSPYYGPGGIPFAYPPFGLYLLAVPIKLTGKYFIFLRFLPPLISLLALIPLFYLMRELSGSPVAGAITVVLTAASMDLYMAHAWAAGITRAPAFLFTLAFLYFQTLQLRTHSRSHQVLAGICLGLAAMSHLLYALFCFLWLAWSMLLDQKQVLPLKLKATFVILLVGTIMASIWLVPTILRHGVTVFVHAIGSHGAQASLFFWQDIFAMLNSLRNGLEPLTANIYLSILVLVGFVYLLFRRKYAFLLLFLVIVLIFPERERFVSFFGCMIAGMGLYGLLDRMYRTPNGQLKASALAVFAIPLIGMVWWNSLQQIAESSPFLDGSTLEIAKEVQLISNPDANYLALLKQDEAEWLPFVFQREPLVAQWGSEWLGEYDRQIYLMSSLRACQKIQDWACIESLIDEIGTYPDYVITYTSDRKLNAQLESLGQWEEVYRNSRYVLWSKAN
jgi:hypothetical protein